MLCRLVTIKTGVVKVSLSEAGSRTSPHEILFTNPTIAHDTARQLAQDYRMRGWIDCG
jgi:hypothetical protein